ncbi:unnamed protein product [Rotaria sp. Silwood1]|nr:unnamed protein product [Rotaria sp. Silwood1]CAF1600371.1 unnamed protein product [Rotaria sp. Silwood1]CAF3924914.1 unnamed protein product [Rotaria sp. Silwood1]
MTSEDDEDTEMVMEQKSRFSRYRCRVREKINSDLNEAMALDDCSDSEVDNAPITRHQNNSSVENESTVHNNDFNANENQWISQESNQYTEKPKKNEYAIILQDIVNELKLLENVDFDVLFPSADRNQKSAYKHFYAFTIAAVCDKSAHSLIMSIKDPTGFFSCGWCYIPGATPESGSRFFISKNDTTIKLRDNKSYDRLLPFFNKRKMIHLWFGTVKTDYSLKNQFVHIEKSLQTIHYPITNRLPRILRFYKIWKANEFRITLLFAYWYTYAMLIA